MVRVFKTNFRKPYKDTIGTKVKADAVLGDVTYVYVSVDRQGIKRHGTSILKVTTITDDEIIKQVFFRIPIVADVYISRNRNINLIKRVLLKVKGTKSTKKKGDEKYKIESLYKFRLGKLGK